MKQFVESLGDDSFFSQVTDTFSLVTTACRKTGILKAGGFLVPRDREDERPKTTASEDVDILACFNPFTSPVYRLPEDRIKSKIWEAEPGSIDRQALWSRLFLETETVDLNTDALIQIYKRLEGYVFESNDISALLGKELREGVLVNPVIVKDVMRTDRSIPFFGSDDTLIKMISILHFCVPEYVQGMNDILAPILFVFQGKMVPSCYIFVSILTRKDTNLIDCFHEKESRINRDLDSLGRILRAVSPEMYRLAAHETIPSFLLVCYRWLLLWFKREFLFSSTIRLWEVRTDSQNYAFYRRCI